MSTEYVERLGCMSRVFAIDGFNPEEFILKAYSDDERNVAHLHEAIRRWNCHTQLVEALEVAKAYVIASAEMAKANGLMDNFVLAQEDLERIKAALAAAKGEVG